MRTFNKLTKEVAKLIDENKLGIIPTDTIYGVVGSAMSPRIVEKIYTVKGRDRKKPMIVLISSEKDLEKYFEIDCPQELIDLWPARLSVILSCSKYPHIHRGKETIAFRVPDNKELREFISKTGPLVAPSANPEGRSPALTIGEAKTYFGSKVDFYVNAGKLNKKASTLVEYSDGGFKVLREGDFSLE